MTGLPIVYLHGFASSRASKKARWFGERFAARNVEFVVPDLADGDFAGLALSKQLAVVERAAAGRRVRLMGSSMGGYLAALYAARHPDQVDRMVLMAPAFDFASRWRARLGEDDFNKWQQTGRLNVFHYGENGDAWVGFQLYTDALTHAAYPQTPQPALVFHGTADDVVPYTLSHEYARRNPSARIRLFASGHELIDVLEPMWEETCAFFAL